MTVFETESVDDALNGRVAAEPPEGLYEVLDGRMTCDELHDVIRSVLHDDGRPTTEHTLEVLQPGNYRVRLGDSCLEIRSRPLPDVAPDTLDHILPAAGSRRVLLTTSGPLPDDIRALFVSLLEKLTLRGQCYSEAEIDSIVRAMPLVDRYATKEPALADWALIFRDHYVENSVGFLLGMERAGLDPNWVFALSKGDRTLHRSRVHAWFLNHGYLSDVLDNSVINDTADTAAQAYALGVNERVNAFIRQAHAAGRKVLVIDDGGLLAQGYGADGVLTEYIDAALELTVSGLKRIANAPGELSIPVLNMARSRLKTMLGYNEIADSCVRRLRAILPGEKFIGRHVLILGFGTLGARVAYALRSLGCRVSVVDTDILALITAAEHGFETYQTAAEALRGHSPFLVIGGTGELAITAEDLPLLPDGVYLAGFATKDFSILSEGFEGVESTVVPYVGVRHVLPSGAAATVLGDGRSLNLFEYEGIANRGYDAYRAGTLIAAKTLCRDIGSLDPGLHLEPVDRAIDEAELFHAYYSEYLSGKQHRTAAPEHLLTATAL
ncbi:hypothetical protein [Streptomyces scopuliridis]|uniref:S-adenosyl-L-homocysteine hydrolase NAD binding domain-containing protein n=1 Tax=Streptomyces scopuliridis RB72 TaxID=1440053 RepID=A0A2T7T4A4_9ACTN|nr:hypothetical protein [Streptomyces scopuliridis]PVE09959.1 hypothetical protein Y717_22575 [Streptomyces scopuliridis RB72]